MIVLGIAHDFAFLPKNLLLNQLNNVDEDPFDWQRGLTQQIYL